MSVSELPQPERWRTRPLLIRFALAFFALGALYEMMQTAVAVQRGGYLSAIVSAGMATLTFGLALGIVVGRVRSKTLRGVVDSTGTTLRADPVTTFIFGVTFAVATPCAALYLVCAPRGEVHIPFAAPGREVVTYFYMTVIFICGLGALIALAFRRGRIHVRLSPDGFEFANALATQQGRWEDVTDVTDEAANKQANHPIVLVMKNAKPIVVKNADGYAPSGPALYWMVRHYWKHPERRDELTDGRALERLRTEDFVPE